MNKHSGWLSAVILTALPVEYREVRSHLTALKEEVCKGTVYERGRFESERCHWNVGIVQVGMGNAPTAAEAERAIAYFQPQVILFVGIAGGLKDVQIGDVVAASKIYGYESGKVGLTFQTRPEVGRSTHRMEQRARIEAIKNNWLKRLKPQLPDPLPRVFVAPIAAGEKVLASTRSATWRFLSSKYGDAVAVETEGHGFFSATHVNQQVDALIVRGISDLVDNKSRTDAMNSQQIAVRHATAFAFEVLANLSTEEQALASKEKPQLTGEIDHSVTIKNIRSVQSPIQVGNQNIINHIASSIDEREEGMASLERGQIALSYGDYSSAKKHFTRAVQLLSCDQEPEKSAQARYLLALTFLREERPFGVTLQMWERVEELLQTSVQLNPCYSYLYTLALFKTDFSRNGWKKVQYLQEAQQLMQEAKNLPQLAVDKQNIALLWKNQTKLMQEAKNLDK